MESKESRFARSYLDSPIGKLRLEENERGITAVKVQEDTPMPPEEGGEGRYLKRLKEELGEYFAGRRQTFDLPLAPEGTPFQQKVWEALREIPYGETRSYGQIAEAVGNPKAARAVGMANNKNRILILTPCHRVIGADGSLVGFGCGLEKKVFLLELESKR